MEMLSVTMAVFTAAVCYCYVFLEFETLDIPSVDNNTKTPHTCLKEALRYRTQVCVTCVR